MTRYLVRRLLWGVVLLALVSAVTFVLFYVLPSGDPAQMRAGRNASPETVEQIRRSLGLDAPLWEQYWRFLKGLVLRFDLGYSYYSGAPVTSLIADRLPATASLAAGAVVLWVVLGTPIAVVAALRPRSWLDRLLMGGALVAISAPVYWVGLLALYLLADDIGALPLLPGAGSYVPLTEDPGRWLGSLVLPWLVLAGAFTAAYARLLRARLIEAMGEDHVRTARAKGLPERRVVLRHGVRTAIGPVVTAAGIELGLLLGGAVLVETVFNVPGIGRLSYDAIVHADLPVIQGTVLLAALAVVVMSIVVDVACAILDPRVRLR